MIVSRCLPARLIFCQVGRRVPGDPPGRQLLEQLAVADDGVQGRAQLVAHVGQERALDLVGLDGLPVGRDEVGVDPAQLLLDPLAPGDLLLEHRVGPGQLGRALAHPAFQLVVGLAEVLLGLLPRRDVEGDPLEVEGLALLVAHHLGLAVDPDDAAVAGQEAVLGAEMPARGAGLRELGVPSDAVVRVELPIPQDRVLQPFLLGEAQQRLDLRADVELVVPALERRP